MVVVLGGGTVVVVQQLAQTGESSIATDDPVTSDVIAPASTAPVSTPASTIADPNAITPELVPGSVPATAPPVASGAEGEVPLANLVESNLSGTSSNRIRRKRWRG